MRYAEVKCVQGKVWLSTGVSEQHASLLLHSSVAFAGGALQCQA